MYIQNISGKFQTFRIGTDRFRAAPNDVLTLSDKQSADPTVSFLLSRKLFRKVTKESAVERMEEIAAEKSAKDAERKLEVKKVDESTSQQVIMAQCSGIKKDGERCGNNVAVNAAEYDKEKKYFCRLHIKQAAVSDSKPKVEDSGVVVRESEETPVTGE